jgi:hypothetical protein
VSDQSPLVLSLAAVIQKQASEIQKLQDEIQRLKKTTVRPEIKPSVSGTNWPCLNRGESPGFLFYVNAGVESNAREGRQSSSDREATSDPQGVFCLS